MLGRASERCELSWTALGVGRLPSTHILVVVGEGALGGDAGLPVPDIDLIMASKVLVTTAASRYDAIGVASRHGLRLVRETWTLKVVSVEE